MAVKDDVFYPTESLILPKPRRHFRTSVTAVHWQLRSLIGTEKQNIVYFPSGSQNLQVQRLNTTTRETETIKRLPFQPRCLVAQNGWVCCGGETGEFAAIRVGENSTESDADARPELDPDDDLPILLSLAGSESGILQSLARARASKNMLAKSKTFGKERVNCITLWFPPTLVKPIEGAYDQPAAVLANNDRTVSIVGLRQQNSLDCVSYPDCVNRAVISPDGRLLVAISDDPYLYVHERTEKATGSMGSSSTWQWSACTRIHLKSQSKEDRSDNRGSFAACFSSTGRYLAVGTQYGVISIFNVPALTVQGVDPLLTTFTSSRPNAELGAVRDMAFAPGPIDLLAWTEDRGRVGVVDIRSGFTARQILYLDKPDDYEHIGVTDRSSIDPRLLEQRSAGHDTLSSSFAHTLDLSLEGRQSRRSEAQDQPERFRYPPLTPDETMVLEALQEHRRRREQRAAASVNANSRFAWAERATRSMANSDSARPRERSASVSRTVSDILGNMRDQRDLTRVNQDLLDQRERLRENQERLRENEERLRAVMRDDIAAAERRRPAVPPAVAGRVAVLGATVNGERDGERRASGTRLSPNTLPPPPAGSGWSDIEALYHLSFDGTMPPHDGLRSSAAGDGEVRRRDRTALMREWEENANRRGVGIYFSPHARPDPHDTAGLSWSENGQILFVGAEDGIYEFNVNMFRRKLSPSVTLC
ncbi:hypothetical protein QBC46DRAFT_148581 [Diplogelasinospora grovesii]|uniref:DUF2415 domain-containing protein n=1 Tax=Diplogelasinospora grovesii TaxID=303347 RepID=A0AAN6S9F6_9PEZI|nr:hypothetical protein QBC46DRAFT_148581 [Diplogelasinospora grovesii]